MERQYLGIDPGKSGGAAWLTDVGEVLSTIRFTETEHDINAWFLAIDSVFHAVIERVHSMPKQGVKSTFTFGQQYGFCRGMLVAHGFSFSEVSPGVWQRKQGCLTRGDKKISYRRAQQLFPEIKITHAIADALLIADYARKLENGR